MSNTFLKLARENTAVRGPAKAILRALADRANERGECWPSRARIAADAGLAISTVKKHLRTLAEAGLVRWEARFSLEGDRDSNLYRLNLAATPAEAGQAGESSAGRGGSSGDLPGSSGDPGVGHDVTGGGSPRAPKASGKPKDEPKGTADAGNEGNVIDGRGVLFRMFEMRKIPQVPTFTALVAGVCLAGFSRSGAAVGYATAGSTYQQPFNTLADTGSTNTWVDDTTLPGWYAAQNTNGTVTNWSTYTAGSGAANQGLLMSLGTTAGDRALGGQNANTTAPAITTMYYALGLTNTTGTTLNTFSLSYVGEQWRFVQNEFRDGMTFQYQVFAAGTGSITAATGWTSVAGLGFDAPIASTDTSNNLNGNSAANRVAVSGAVTEVSWTNGSELWLRWADSSSGINAAAGATRSMLGIDDVAFTAVVPEPSAALLSGLGLAAVAIRRRRE